MSCDSLRIVRHSGTSSSRHEPYAVWVEFGRVCLVMNVIGAPLPPCFGSTRCWPAMAASVPSRAWFIMIQICSGGILDALALMTGMFLVCEMALATCWSGVSLVLNGCMSKLCGM